MNDKKPDFFSEVLSGVLDEKNKAKSAARIKEYNEASLKRKEEMKWKHYDPTQIRYVDGISQPGRKEVIEKNNNKENDDNYTFLVDFDF